MIRMIATDLDGTLLSEKSNIPERNIHALQRAMQAGVKVVLASGRMIEATLPIAEKIGVNAPMVVLNGAMLYDPAADRILAGSAIPCETARAILEFLEARSIYVHAFPGRRFYYEKRCAWTEYYENKISVIGVETGVPLSRWLSADVYKLLCLGQPTELDVLIPELQQKFPQVSFVKSGLQHLEIILRGVDKGTGMARLCEICNIAPEEVLAFGDEENDLPLISFAGTSYVMENAPESVRRTAQRIAPRNTDCGVARIVELYLNEKRMGGA